MIFFLTYLFFEEFNRKKRLGNLIFKASWEKSTKIYSIFYAVMLVFWMIIFVKDWGNIGQEYYGNPIFNVGSSGLFILLMIYNLLRCFTAHEIRQKGMTAVEGFLYWKDLTSYRWTAEDKLEGTFQLKFLSLLEWRKKKIIMIPQEFKNEVANILDKYVNADQIEK